MKFKTLTFAAMLIFVTGIAAGGLWVNHLQHAKPRLLRRQPPVSGNHTANLRPPEVLSQTFLQSLNENLHLTPEESEAIQKIMSDGQNEMRKVVQDSRLEIREILTPPQRLKFDKIIKRRFHNPIFITNEPSFLTSASQ